VTGNLVATRSVHRDAVRLWASRNLAVTVFLGAYFLTIVVGNLIFASPIGRESLKASRLSDRFLAFPQTFTLGYWMLLLCPFILTPLIVSATRRLSARWVRRAVEILPEFSRFEYAVLCVALFAFVIGQFWSADVPALFASGADDLASVQARFTIRERIGYITLVPLQACLPYLTVYSLIRAIESHEQFWIAFTIANTLLLSLLLIMTNMRWPVLLFSLSMVLTAFVYARRLPYLKVAAGTVLVFAAFLLVSTFFFRLAPAQGSSQPGRADIVQTSQHVLESVTAARRYAPDLLISALNRMAIAYPYYYQVFTEEGTVCGGVIAQARRNPACRPSEMINARIYGLRTFGADEFENQGTSPLAVHISGYALGGWPVALLALGAGSIMLGLFAALPLDHGASSGSLTILGASVGYHLSQIPGEGVVFYEHGLIWPLLLILGYLLWRWMVSATKRRIAS